MRNWYVSLCTWRPGKLSQAFERHRRRVYSACRVFLARGQFRGGRHPRNVPACIPECRSFLAGNFIGWLMRIAKNVCIDQWRRNRTNPISAMKKWRNLADGKCLEHSTLMRLVLEKVLAEMSHLPEEQRRCLELKVAGYSYEETAALTGYSTAAV